jgi:hypothetical protein
MTRIEEIWHAIRQGTAGTTLPETGWALVRVDDRHRFDIYAGMDSGGAAMLAVGTSSRPPGMDAETGALEYVRIQRAGGSWIMALRLGKAGLETVFGRLCQDLADAAADVATEAALINLFRERLLLWKRLFRDGGSGLLENFQIKGLTAELLALEGFIAACPTDPLAPLLAWTGPAGACQDFIFSEHAVEIKAVSPAAEAVGISSAEQLHDSVPLELRVYALREASPSEANAVTLPTLVSRIERLISDTQSAGTLFRNRLLEAGFIEHDHYHTVAFTLSSVRGYAVADGFPRLVPANLPAGIPTVMYSILFSSISPFLKHHYAHAF